MLLSSLLGALVGLSLGLTGAGGGIVALPLLTYGAGLSMTEASPIALIAVGMVALVATGLDLREGIVRYRAALVIGVVGMGTAPGGIWLAHRLPAQWLSCGLVAALSGIRPGDVPEKSGVRGAALTSVSAPVLVCCWSPPTGRFVWTWPCARAFLGIGALAGGLSGLLGVGAASSSFLRERLAAPS